MSLEATNSKVSRPSFRVVGAQCPDRFVFPGARCIEGRQFQFELRFVARNQRGLVDSPDSLALRNGAKKSIGIGKNVVVLCSLEISFMVCK
jgi:hypothetical protein